MGISTRPAVASDEEFVNALTRETMRPYVQATWPSDEEREKYYWINRFQQNETEIIQVDREDAGRITITRRPGCIVLEEETVASLPGPIRRSLGRNRENRLGTRSMPPSWPPTRRTA
jgi:hypothetical protein